MSERYSSLLGWPSLVVWNIELVLLVVANVSCCMFLAVLKQSKCFHLNLRLLLANFSITFLLIIISRYLIVVPLWMAFVFDVDVAGKAYCRVAKTLHDTAVYVSGLGLAVLVLERTLATVFVHKYESSRRRTVGCLLVGIQVCQWLGGLIFVLCNQIDHDKASEYSALACKVEYTSPNALRTSLITIITMDIIAVIVFFVILKINVLHYKNSNEQRARQNLSERYQTSENIQATRLLLPLVAVYLAASLIGGGIMMLATFAGTISSDQRQFFQSYGVVFQLFDVLIASYAAVFPFLAIRGHRPLLLKMRQMMFASRIKATSLDTVPLSVDGKRLALPPNEETETHFAQLEAMWMK